MIISRDVCHYSTYIKFSILLAEKEFFKILLERGRSVFNFKRDEN